ncbi:MAG: type II toxin-antitoxin system PemK/MazF family toxin [Dehalococcoidia bacterium]|nr:type II toxin-antitoxin system PemK/MazF family toxin [Dehalococcoidia bacterium]
MSREIRWGIFSAALGSGEGSEQAGQRPVMVISNDGFNQVMPIVTVLPLTSLKPGRRIYPSEVLLSKGEANLPEDSIVLAHQIRTISKTRLRNPYGYINDPEIRRRVEVALRIHLDLEE